MTARFVIGPMVAVVLLAFAAVAAPAALADTFVVNAADDDGGPGTCTGAHCSLRQAITAANTATAPDTIKFNLPVTLTRRCVTIFFCTTIVSTDPIQLTASLPVITSPLTIDGRTQPSFSNSPLVEIRGPGSTSHVDGLKLGLGSDHSVIRSIAATSLRFGIVVVSSENLVAGSRLGVDTSGAARGNFNGIVIEGSDNQIGGSNTAGDGNVISGNTSEGVAVCLTCAESTGSGSGTASENVIVGNLIGTNPAGTAAMGNQDGVTVFGRGFNTTLGDYDPFVAHNDIGGGTLIPTYRNVISGNRGSGVFVHGSVRTVLGGNLIGLNAAGTAAVPNGGAGLLLDDAPNTVAGDFGNVTRPCVIFGHPSNCPIVYEGPNVISGNTGDGVRIFNTVHTHDIQIVGNTIGTDPSGAIDLGNGGNGVNLSGVASSTNNLIGDTGRSNVIAFNHGDGVFVDFTAPSIRFNQIFSNVGLGIHIATINSVPVTLASAVSTTTNTTVQGHIIRGPFAGTQVFTLDFYAGPSCDPSGSGEGADYIGTTSVTSTSALASTFFTATFDRSVAAGAVVTATNTGSAGASSEFSRCQVVASN